MQRNQPKNTVIVIRLLLLIIIDLNLFIKSINFIDLTRNILNHPHKPIVALKINQRLPKLFNIFDNMLYFILQLQNIFVLVVFRSLVHNRHAEMT